MARLYPCADCGTELDADQEAETMAHASRCPGAAPTPEQQAETMAHARACPGAEAPTPEPRPQPPLPGAEAHAYAKRLMVLEGVERCTDWSPSDVAEMLARAFADGRATGCAQGRRDLAEIERLCTLLTPGGYDQLSLTFDGQWTASFGPVPAAQGEPADTMLGALRNLCVALAAEERKCAARSIAEAERFEALAKEGS
jgi:hypothetical protein